MNSTRQRSCMKDDNVHRLTQAASRETQEFGHKKKKGGENVENAESERRTRTGKISLNGLRIVKASAKRSPACELLKIASDGSGSGSGSSGGSSSCDASGDSNSGGSSNERTTD
ncbi:hypothetical protein AWZ03_011255 [Drosophila navojoa]|uniref:Uncharacterized protein n=1 Tax=Drosophila navojoa TaxID=7232 RepID=A0A484B0D1_DRONA|nr:hypothetical protein AWZ03_011255 [Drosophila navojoa]